MWSRCAPESARTGDPSPPLHIFDRFTLIQNHESDAAKATLFKAVREGKVRILLGSTPKMGEGTNVQKRLVALHHLDAPWRPADIQQREGRILRQGNQNEYVSIYRYMTEGVLTPTFGKHRRTKRASPRR